MKIFFKTNLIIWFLYFENQQIRSYSRFIFLRMTFFFQYRREYDPHFVQNDFLFSMDGVLPRSLVRHLSTNKNLMHVLIRSVITDQSLPVGTHANKMPWITVFICIKIDR